MELNALSIYANLIPTQSVQSLVRFFCRLDVIGCKEHCEHRDDEREE